MKRLTEMETVKYSKKLSICLVLLVVVCKTIANPTCSVTTNESGSKVNFSFDLFSYPGLSVKHGKAGPRGQKGEIGLRGTPGPIGAIGQKGEIGLTGSPGPRGSKGECPSDLIADYNLRLEALEKRVQFLESGWITFGSYKFWFGEQATIRSVAKDIFRLKSASMVAKGIRDNNARQFIMNIIRDRKEIYWIGLDDIQTEGNFIWSDGVASTSSNTNWASREPNNDNNQDCGTLRHNTEGVDDDWCHVLHPVICEKNI